ncbi:MAG: phosphate signaling complex protein PhoU [Methanomassiliicoccales archaeon]|nr:phosphate signaling complex protein PhoU [Methanomassiliicoccales archaeon]
MTRIVLSDELAKLNEEVAEMGKLAREAIDKAIRAIVNEEFALKDEVKKLDDAIYQWDLKIEKHCIDLIALHSPVASDLRIVSTSLKMITDLNRIGRYARDIAEVIDFLEGQRYFKRLVSIPHMASLVIRMVDDAVESFIKRDADKALDLFERDDEVDALYESIFREVLTYMMEDPKKVPMGMRFILIARYLERIADHACNIGERVIYMISGERVERVRHSQKIM